MKINQKQLAKFIGQKLVFLAEDWTEEQINAALDNLTEEAICTGLALASSKGDPLIVTSPYSKASHSTYGVNDL
jgi:hypothetical protein